MLCELHEQYAELKILSAVSDSDIVKACQMLISSACPFEEGVPSRQQVEGEGSVLQLVEKKKKKKSWNLARHRNIYGPVAKFLPLDSAAFDPYE